MIQDNIKLLTVYYDADLPHHSGRKKHLHLQTARLECREI